MREQADLATVSRLGQLTETVHAVVYFAPEARSAYEHMGLRGFWRGYFASRCAAVGAIGPDLATALLGGFAPAMVARALPQLWSTVAPAAIVAARTDAAGAALHRLLPDAAPDLAAEAAALTHRCVQALEVPGRPMAAAHRETPRPADPIGALWHDATVLREHRGDGHLAAICAAGLPWPDPHVLISDRLDPAQQAHRGWSDEQWAAAQRRVEKLGVTQTLVDAIDERTDRLAAPAYDALTDSERLDLATLLGPLAEAACTELPFPNAMGLQRLATRAAGR